MVCDTSQRFPRATQGEVKPPDLGDPVPLFTAELGANGQRVISGLQPAFMSHFNPGEIWPTRCTH